MEIEKEKEKEIKADHVNIQFQLIADIREENVGELI